jgi:nicotinate-nucleotide adenylyltransferase
VNIALFGGTFDPIHTGHVQAARAAARKFGLDRVLFIPTGKPPHKHGDRLTPFPQRYAMTVLACARDQRLVPSLLEAPTPEGKPCYSIDTVGKVRRTLHKSDRLFFLIGVDAFLELPHWKEYRRLLDLVDFIVVSRPGFDANEIRKVVSKAMAPSRGARLRPLIPAPLRTGSRGDGLEQSLLPSSARRGGAGHPETIRLRRSTLHVLWGVHMPVASHAIRRAIAAGRSVTGLVPPLVEEYILKEGLYCPRHGEKEGAAFSGQRGI